jgi:CBS-domain-containing membrane protein
VYAEEIMTRTVRAIHHGASWRDALPLLLREGYHAVPIIEDTNRVVGIITQTDLARRISGAERAQLRAILDGVVTIRSFRTLVRWHTQPCWDRGSRIASLMSKPVIAVHPKTSITNVARILAEHEISQVLVTERDGELRGLVRQEDIIAAVARAGAASPFHQWAHSSPITRP